MHKQTQTHNILQSFIYTKTCHVQMRGQPRDMCVPLEYGKRIVKRGDVIGVLLDIEMGEISFYVNGEDLGVAYHDITGPLCPAVEMGMMISNHHVYTADFSAK